MCAVQKSFKVVNTAFIALPCAVIAIGLTANRSKKAYIAAYAKSPNFALRQEQKVRCQLNSQVIEYKEVSGMKNSG